MATFNYLRIGDTVPNFQSETQLGKIDFYEWAGDKWVVFFSHPSDYTPVCTTELGAVSKLLPEFEKRGVKVIALSVDDAESHKGWIQDINATQNTTVSYPIIADAHREVANLYGMVSPNAPDTAQGKQTIRTVFVIGNDKKLKLSLTYPASTGRNFDEVLRVVDSLQLTANHSVATPVNWKQGEKVMILPSVTNDKAKELFPQGWNVVDTPSKKEYIRQVQLTK